MGEVQPITWTLNVNDNNEGGMSMGSSITQPPHFEGFRRCWIKDNVKKFQVKC